MPQFKLNADIIEEKKFSVENEKRMMPLNIFFTSITMPIV